MLRRWWFGWLPWLVACASNPPLELPPPDPTVRALDGGMAITLGDAGTPTEAPGRDAALAAPSDAGAGPVQTTIDAGPENPPATDAGAPDAGPPAVDCTAYGRFGYAICSATSDRCDIVFYDSQGCTAACARAGLVCLDSWNNVDGACAARLTEHAGCANTAHESDYCVCGLR